MNKQKQTTNSNGKYSLEERINHLNQQLNNHPHGIHHEKLPNDKELQDYMTALLHNEKAIWVKHPDGWRYVLLRPNMKPPFGISKWVWE